VPRKVRWEERFPLHFLAMAGDVDALESMPLPVGNTGLNRKDDDTWTPGHYAAFYGHTDFLRALLLAGADANACNLNRCSLLHFAAGRGNQECCKILLEFGANPSSLDDDKMSPAARARELQPASWLAVEFVINLCKYFRPRLRDWCTHTHVFAFEPRSPLRLPHPNSCTGSHA
jgi:ankyrin repeat protein